MDKDAERHFPDQDPERIEKIRRIAYHLWLARKENNIPGDADQDYFQAERIFESKTRRQLLLGSFCVWSVTYLAARSSEAQLESAAVAGVALKDLLEEHDLSLHRSSAAANERCRL
ncbi:MAG TPA: hypothetical protein VE860_10320 [Chthoniobacterales bacterium]|jgi:hypothetical protein|nr:hypothetical protein [Chthoniobacterales bacterium]